MSKGDAQGTRQTAHRRFKLRILVIRHGQTNHNLARILQGHLDTPLNATGTDQARRLGQYLRQTGLDPTVDYRKGVTSTAADTTNAGVQRRPIVVWSSDLNRCRQTTETVLRELNLRPTVVPDSDQPETTTTTEDDWEDLDQEVPVFYTTGLRERGMGELQGMPMVEAQAMAREQGKTFQEYGELPGEFQARVAKFYTRFIQSCLARAAAAAEAGFFEDADGRKDSGDLVQTVLVFSHGGFISMLMKHLVNSGLARLGSVIRDEDIKHAGNTSMTTLEIDVDLEDKGGHEKKEGKVPEAVVTTYSYAPHLEKGTVSFRDGQ